MKQLQHVHQLQLDWENPWHSSNVGLAIKTTPINILNETFLNHVVNLKPSGFSQRPSLCTICYLHNQTAIASDCIIHPSINPHCPGKSSRSHVSRARRPKSYQRPWQTSYSGTAERSWQPLLVIHFGPMPLFVLLHPCLCTALPISSRAMVLKQSPPNMRTP